MNLPEEIKGILVDYRRQTTTLDGDTYYEPSPDQATEAILAAVEASLPPKQSKHSPGVPDYLAGYTRGWNDCRDMAKAKLRGGE